MPQGKHIYRPSCADMCVERLPKVTLDQDKCINCKICISTCPMGVYREKSESVEVIKESECIACMGCVAACPVEAIEVYE